jgi:hypothetical protein
MFDSAEAANYRGAMGRTSGESRETGDSTPKLRPLLLLLNVAEYAGGDEIPGNVAHGC